MQRLRSLVFTAFIYSTGIIIGIVTLPVLLLGENATRRVAKFWVRTALSALRYIARVSYRVSGEENIPTGGAIVASNHQSMWETIALYCLMPRPVMVFKKELTHLPIYGWFASRAGNIAVDRNGGPKALRAMRENAAQRIAEGCQIIVFPEGTRIPPGGTGKYHPGVAGIYTAANAPCIPIAHNSGLYWRHPGPDKTPGEISLKVLPQIEPGLDRKEFLNALKTTIDEARPDLVGRRLEEVEPSDG